MKETNNTTAAKYDKAIEDFLESIGGVCGIEKERKAFFAALDKIEQEEKTK